VVVTIRGWWDGGVSLAIKSVRIRRIDIEVEDAITQFGTRVSRQKLQRHREKKNSEGND
jgi:hypothetical protein